MKELLANTLKYTAVFGRMSDSFLLGTGTGFVLCSFKTKALHIVDRQLFLSFTSVKWLSENESVDLIIWIKELYRLNDEK